MSDASYDSFGRLVRVDREADKAGVIARRLSEQVAGSTLAFGQGRSYGDSCHNDQGVLADFRDDKRIVFFNGQSGVVECDAGATLADIIAYCAPAGWFLPVTPGTRFVTIGGAVANDVHGKNHHKRGTFGNHVLALTLARGDGVHHLTPDDQSGLFKATVGGMGLTGFITRVRLQLMRVNSLNVTQVMTPFQTLDAYFDQAEQADSDNEYAVAWLDQLHGERGVLMAANHADDHMLRADAKPPMLGVPFDLPFNALNGLSLRAFNAAFYHAKARKAHQPHVTSWQSYFYPLDAIGNWNRLYGPRGLFQHQSVVPFDRARKAIPALLKASRDAGQASFLTVLKRFGDVASPGLLSFPAPGYTLTLDFPNKGQSTLNLLEVLDRITMEAGGRVNPYKDARMGPLTFERSFPNWQQVEALRDPAIMSNFWKRTALELAKSGNA